MATEQVSGKRSRQKPRNDPRQTPAMRQFAQFKSEYPDCLLLFRMGDFYELFDDDAVTAHKALGLTLTERSSGIPMAGVPYHAVETYLRRLIDQGFRVAVCDQIQDPREAKGIVDRAVTRVVTPGTLVDEGLLEESTSNVVACIQFTESGDTSDAIVAACELSTGRFELLDIPAGRIIDELARLAPSELLHVETADGVTPPRVKAVHDALRCALTTRPAWSFRQRDAFDLLCAQYGVQTLIGFGIADDDPAVGPCGALVRFLQETQATASADHERTIGHLQPPRRQSRDEFVTIDASSLRALEIERTMRTGDTAGSLFSVFQGCRTAMGRRLLRRWLCYPLRSREAIEDRQGVVATLRQDERLARQLGELLDQVQDVARIAGRLGLGRATPRDVVALGRSVAMLTPIHELIDNVPALAHLQNQLAALVDTLTPLATTIATRCIDDPPAHMREGGLFRDGVDAELDEARGLQRDGTSWLAAYQKRLSEETGVSSLKVGYNRVFGYYIELTAVHAANAPDSFTRKQTLKNAERFITPELKEYEQKIMSADSRAIEREKALFDQLCRDAAGQGDEISEYAEIIASLDVLQCFADVAARFGYCRPEIRDEPILRITGGRHPVLDRILGERFVPNDSALGSTSEESGPTLALITGPNMAGKSTFIRQVAIIALLAHTGSFVPAQSAVIGTADRIFTRIGASDELHAGQSTFMVEMTETANILHHATDRSIVILDEIGRGTSTLDGLSLAWAIAETIAARRCRALFATHYHELTTLAEQLDNVTNLHVAVREWGDEIIFVYRIQPGRTDRSYGIHVAKIAGLPVETIRRASSLLDTLAVQTESTPPASGPPTSTSPSEQLSLFTEYVDHPAINRLREVRIEQMTPLGAFDLLREILGDVDLVDTGHNQDDGP